MTVTTNLRVLINSLMRPFNCKLETLTKESLVMTRLCDARAEGHFDQPAYTTPSCMREFKPDFIVDSYRNCRADLDAFLDGSNNKTGFTAKNDFFGSPDAEILYTMVRGLRPKRIIEVGSGNSTKVTKQAIIDGGLTTSLVCIDPMPREDIQGLPECFVQSRAEGRSARAAFSDLESGDILFIDSSHEVSVANDCAHLFCNVLPNLSPGVIVHVHDVFLPFEYPFDWAASGLNWGEQYLLQALLLGFSPEVLWPGYFAQRTMPALCESLPFLRNGRAQSFWLRWKGHHDFIFSPDTQG